MAHRWELEVHGQQVVVNENVIPVLIGRSFDRPVLAVAPMANAYVSRHHCEIRSEDGALWCMDLGSANGTWIHRGTDWIRSPAHERVQLEIGDVLTTIDQTILCTISGVDEPAEASPPVNASATLNAPLRCDLKGGAAADYVQGINPGVGRRTQRNSK